MKPTRQPGHEWRDEKVDVARAARPDVESVTALARQYWIQRVDRVSKKPEAKLAHCHDRRQAHASIGNWPSDSESTALPSVRRPQNRLARVIAT